MRTNTTRYVILGLLSEGPMTGYDIKKIVEIRFRFFWQESYGQIYPQLKTMQEQGLIRHVKDEHADTERTKNKFVITEAGKTEFREWMGLKPEKEVMRIEFLLKLFWAPWIPTSKIQRYVEDFKRRHENELTDLQLMEQQLKTILDEAENHWWILKTVELGVRVNEAYVDWADSLMAEMENRL